MEKILFLKNTLKKWKEWHKKYIRSLWFRILFSPKSNFSTGELFFYYANANRFENRLLWLENRIIQSKANFFNF